MNYPLFNFQGQTAPDQTAQAGLAQYIQQGQQQINPGQPQQSNPIQAAGISNLAQAFARNQQQPGLPAQQGPFTGPNAPIGNLPIAPGQYQSPQALQNAEGPLYPSPYAAQQGQPWLSRMADLLSNSWGSSGGTK